MSNFDPNAILRGAQLTVVGGKHILSIPSLYTQTLIPYIAYRALQNPALFTSDHYRQAALAVAAGIAIRIIVAIPVRAVLAYTHGRKIITQWPDCRHSRHIMDPWTFYGYAKRDMGRGHH